MHPILFQYGPITLRWYGFLIAIGFIVATWVFRKRAHRMGITEQEASNLLLLLFFSGVIGSLLYYVIWQWNEFFANDLREIFMIHHGGLVYYGGFIMACGVLWFWCKTKKRSMVSVADALAPSLVVGQFFGRLGCFMNGCCQGRECSHPWAVRLESPPEWAGIPLHPVQLYEALGLLDIFLVLLVLEKISRYPGQIAWAYVTLYSILRFIVEFFRGDIPHDIFGRFTLAQIVCILLFIVSWICSSRLAFLASKKIRAARAAQLKQSSS